MAALEAMQTLAKEQNRALAAAQLGFQESEAAARRLQLRSDQLERDAASLRHAAFKGYTIRSCCLAMLRTWDAASRWHAAVQGLAIVRDTPLKPAVLICFLQTL